MSPTVLFDLRLVDELHLLRLLIGQPAPQHNAKQERNSNPEGRPHGQQRTVLQGLDGRHVAANLLRRLRQRLVLQNPQPNHLPLQGREVFEQ